MTDKKSFFCDLFIIRVSLKNRWKGYGFQIKGAQKGYFFCLNGLQKGLELDLAKKHPRIGLCRVAPFPGTNRSMSLTNLNSRGLELPVLLSVIDCTICFRTTIFGSAK